MVLFIVFINLSLCINLFASIGVIAPDVKFSADGKWMAYTSGDGRPVILENLKTGEKTELPMHNGIAIYNGVDFSPDSKIVSATAENFMDGICFWDVESGEFLAPCLMGGNTAWTCHNGLDFSPDGNLLATISNKDNGTIIVILDAKNGAIKKELKSNIGPITAVCFSPNGKYLACGSFAENAHINFVRIEILDIETGDSIREFAHQFSFGRTESIDISPNGKTIAWTTQGCQFMRADTSDLDMGYAVSPKKLIYTWGEVKNKKKHYLCANKI